MTQGILSKFFSRDGDEEVDVNFDLITPEEKAEIDDDDSILSPLLDKRRNQILSVWGSPSSGKTLLSVKLARYIASQKKNVVPVFGDLLAPPLPYVCGENSLECRNSMGNIFAAARIFYASYESFINNDKQIKAISDIKNFDAVDIFEQNISGAHFRISHSDEVNKQFLIGNMLGALNQKDSTDFRKVVGKIANEVFVI
ncbi:MAG: hypothetical protein LBC19_01740 [Tannerella sp.]|jgi:hypothetical protein|nr:hypothetical protein [Tannerella sp.]